MTGLQTIERLEADPASDPLALAIGLTQVELPASRLPNLRFESLPYVLLHAALARVPFTQHIIAPLVCEQFDALDLAAELDHAGFTGLLHVIVPRVPRPDIILRELQQMAPDLTVALVERPLI